MATSPTMNAVTPSSGASQIRRRLTRREPRVRRALTRPGCSPRSRSMVWARHALFLFQFVDPAQQVLEGDFIYPDAHFRGPARAGCGWAACRPGRRARRGPRWPAGAPAGTVGRLCCAAGPSSAAISSRRTATARAPSSGGGPLLARLDQRLPDQQEQQGQGQRSAGDDHHDAFARRQLRPVSKELIAHQEVLRRCKAQANLRAVGPSVGRLHVHLHHRVIGKARAQRFQGVAGCCR